MFNKNIFRTVASYLVIVGIVFIASFAQLKLVYAAALTTLSDTQSSLKISTLSDHTIQFVTPSGIAAGQGISVTFPTGYATGTFNINNIDFATSTSSTCSGFTDTSVQSGAASGLTWGVTQATNTLYILSGTATIPANRCVVIRIGSNAVFAASGTSQITNPSSPATYSINVISNSDTGSITENIITDDTVAMTGLVTQSLTFTISTSTIYFGTLSSVGAKYASSTNPLGDSSETVAHTLAVGTNAPSGFTLTVRGQTLTSQQNASNTITFAGAAPVVSATGTEQFGMRATESGGIAVTVDPTFASTTAYGYDGTATSSTILATGSGSTPTSTLSIRYLSNIAAVTEAGTYSAGLVYVATANF